MEEINNNKEQNILKKDAMWLGLLMGVAVPGALYGLLYAISVSLAPQHADLLIKNSTMMLLALFPNLLIMRHYLVKLKLDKTGRGLLLSTFVLAMIYFAFYMKFYA